MPDEKSSEAEYTFRVAELSSQDLAIAEIDGVEAVSRLYNYRVVLASRNREFLPDEIVGQRALITIIMDPNQEGGGRPDDPQIGRYINGIVSRFEHVLDGTSFSRYEAEVVPFVWLLNFRYNSRIFQDLKVKDIITEIFTDAGMTADMYRFELDRDYPVRDYCVQYRESEWDFVQRLMEEEGIFFFFEHEELHSVLVMGDHVGVNAPIVGIAEVPYVPPSGMVFTEHIFDFRLGQQIRTGEVVYRDFEYKKTELKIEGEDKASRDVEVQHYEYPMSYRSTDEKKPEAIRNLAKIRLEEFQATRIQARGATVCHRFEAGRRFKIAEYTRELANPEFMITTMRVTGHQPQALEEDMQGDGGSDPRQNYQVEFECIPAETVFRPAQITPKPIVHGAQTAIVVGPSSEEIYCDEYGRVKVHFHWDRDGEFKETDSCWMRVSHGWAGGGYGAIFLPRIGQEVIVSFMEGNPDRPIVTGRVYNAEQMPPYKLPDEKTKSTIHSNSSLGGEGSNEFRFEDKKGEEQVFLHGEKDYHVRVKNDEVRNVMHDRHKTVGVDDPNSTGGYSNERVFKVRSRIVNEDETTRVDGTRFRNTRKDVCEVVARNHIEEIGQTFSLRTGDSVVIEAENQISLKVGGSFIDISAAEIAISAGQVLINSGGSAAPGIPLQTWIDPTEPDSADTVTPGEDHDYTGLKKPPPPLPIPEIGPQSWVKIELTDEEGNPVPGEGYIVKTADGREIKGNLDAQGKAHVGGLKAGEVEVIFPRRDKEEIK